MTIYNKLDLYQQAQEFIEVCYLELQKQELIEARLAEIKAEIDQYGLYEHNQEELEHGAKMAWRNSNKCIGRLFWNSLRVHDAREASTVQDVYAALLGHIQRATNNGKILPTITIFKPQVEKQPEIRIWNHQLIRYAGYQTEGGIIGDPASLKFTQVCQELGWKGRGTSFDPLPLVVQMSGETPQWLDIPQELILEVEIQHPDYAWFKDLQLKWYAVPMIADMKLEIGGLQYPAAPFNGWYMGTEIGARNFADEARYNLLPKVASCLGLDTSRNSTLWKDRALTELNVAVLYSFKQAGVSIVDHHTAAEQFKHFEQQEAHAGRQVTGDWTWLIPPMSPATTHVFHQPYKNKTLSPNYYYQQAPYE